MIDEVKKQWASANSLMERMEKHYTKDYAEFHLYNKINETIGKSTQLYVNYDIRKVGDPQNKTNIVKVYIHPLYPQDAKTLCNISPFKEDNGRCSADTRKMNNGKIENYFTFWRPILSNKRISKPNDNNDDTPLSSNPLFAAMGLSEAINLSALKGMMAQNNPSPETNANNKHLNDSMYNVLKECFDSIANYLYNCNNYDTASINALKDFDSIYNAYLSQTIVNDVVYPDINDEQISDTLFNALKQGNWQNFLSGMYNPLDLDSIIFGQPLSPKNRQRVITRALQYGIDPMSGRVNHLHGASEWKRFGRKLKQSPQYPFPVEVPMVGTHGVSNARKKIVGSGNTIDDGFHGYKAKYDSFNNVGTGSNYGMRNIYPIEDTELINPNDTNDYFNDIPGILNNFNGGLNQKAIDIKGGIQQKIDTTLTPKEKQTIVDTQTIDGKAIIFNESLMAYAEKFPRYKNTIIDIKNSPSPISDYIKNIRELGKGFVISQGFSNPTIVSIAGDLFAFGVACYTVGVDEVKAHTSYNLRDNYKDNISKINAGLETLINFIHHQLNLRYEPLRDKIQTIINDDTKLNSEQQLETKPTTTDTAQQSQITENKNIIDKDIYNLSKLLDELNNIYE